MGLSGYDFVQKYVLIPGYVVLTCSCPLFNSLDLPGEGVVHAGDLVAAVPGSEERGAEEGGAQEPTQVPGALQGHCQHEGQGGE